MMEENLVTPAVLGVPPKVEELGWQIESLIKRAFGRTRERFLSYFLALIISFTFILVALIILVLLLVVGGLGVALTKMALVSFLISLMMVLLAGLVLIFVSSWIQLSVIEILIQNDNLGVIETFKKVRPLVWDYLTFVLLSSLFMLGLLPLGLMSLGIAFLLWSFWNSFSTFVYLTNRQKGIANLWQSRALVNQRFWEIAGRMLILNLMVIFISLILAMSKSSYLGVVSVIFSFVSQPFLISFSFEMYRNLPKPVEAKGPRAWFLLSVAGWILVALYLSWAVPAALKKLPEILPQFQKEFFTELQRNQNLQKQLLPQGYSDQNNFLERESPVRTL